MTRPHATLTLGTMRDLGLNGKLLEDVASILRGRMSVTRRRCRSCGFRLFVVVGDGSVALHARALDSSDPLTHCDDCWAKRERAEKEAVNGNV